MTAMPSAGGHPSHPAWYHNISANPAVTVEIGTESSLRCHIFAG